jgi:hypothetical protein
MDMYESAMSPRSPNRAAFTAGRQSAFGLYLANASLASFSAKNVCVGPMRGRALQTVRRAKPQFDGSLSSRLHASVYNWNASSRFDAAPYLPASTLMTHLVAMAIVITTALAGCGVETATTAATVAAARKQELQQGQRQLDQAKQRIATAMEESRQRARRTEEAAQ